MELHPPYKKKRIIPISELHPPYKKNNINRVEEKVFDAILKLLKEDNVLSIYIDYITDFVEEIEDKLGANTWSKVRNAFRRKRKKDEMDFEEDELEFSKLESILKDVKMTVNEFNY